MVEMKVFGLAMDEKSQAPVLILKNSTEERVLPIWIGAMEAMSISLALNKVVFPRPMTHDLLLSVVEGLGGHVNAVEVTNIDDGTFYAELVVDHGGEILRIDSRPSDAIAVAVRAEAAILVHEEVLEEAGTHTVADYEKVLKSDESDKWAEELEKFSEEDSKYKM